MSFTSMDPKSPLIDKVVKTPGVAILPFRLADKAKKEFPDLLFPINSESERLNNKKRIDEAEYLTMFIDDDFSKPDKSIGTKTEYLANKNKVRSIYRLVGDKFIDVNKIFVDDLLAESHNTYAGV